ncbi:reverse transcriptase domain-containing protein [Tanacetum coccineum]
MPSHIKTYDGSEDPEDYLKIFQAVANIERWVMPTWCHTFNSTLTGNARVWFGDLPPESIDSYDDLKKAFLENYLQQKKCIKDPIEIHNIKQREGESKEEFVKRYKLESRNVKGDPECMRISGLLQRNLDIFAWKPADMTGVPRHMAEHHLNVREGCSPVRQKKRGQAADRNQLEDVRRFQRSKQSMPKRRLSATENRLEAPMEKEELIVYLAAAKETVSAVLVTEREAKQMPIYFVSRALRGTIDNSNHERSYTTDYYQDEVAGRRQRPEEDSPDTPMEEKEELPKPWILFTDGSSCTDGSGVGLILTNPKGMEFTYALRFRFDETTTRAEYELDC